LGALCVLYVLMAALPAAPGSNIVLATSGGSPAWLLGPLRFAGASGADGPLAGPLFYAALWLALLLYVAVLVGARSLGMQVALGAVVAMHVVFFLAPPLLSHDVFSYIAYARLGVANHLNPYTHAPLDIPNDPGFVHAGSIDADSAYGPVFTLLTYPLSPLGVPAAFWILKAVAALSSLGIVALVWRIAERLGRDPVVPALAVGLNPLVLVHVVGGAHNEALTLLVTMAGVLLWVGGRGIAGTATAAAAAGIKASAVIAVPFLALADRAQAMRRVVAAIATAVAVAALGLTVFGTHALDALSLISDNQDRTSRFSVPHKVAEVVGGSDVVRGVFAVAAVAVALWLLWRTWRGLIDPLDAIGWATFAVLIASAWLVPWYILWLLPFAALSRDRRLQLATLALTAWMLAIAVPLS
jgi:Glycosyltransferase family 87